LIRLGSSLKQDLGISSKLTKVFLYEKDLQDSPEPQKAFIEATQLKLQSDQRFYNASKAMCLLVSDDSGYVYLFEIESLLEEILGEKSGAQKSHNNKKSKGYYPLRKVTLKDNGIFFTEAHLLLEQVKDRENRAHERPIPPPKIFTVLGGELGGERSLAGIRFNSTHEGLNVLSVLNLTQKIIATSSNSTIVRLWSLFGDMLGVIDID